MGCGSARRGRWEQRTGCRLATSCVWWSWASRGSSPVLLVAGGRHEVRARRVAKLPDALRERRRRRVEGAAVVVVLREGSGGRVLSAAVLEHCCVGPRTHAGSNETSWWLAARMGPPECHSMRSTVGISCVSRPLASLDELSAQAESSSLVRAWPPREHALTSSDAQNGELQHGGHVRARALSFAAVRAQPLGAAWTAAG